RTCGSGRAARRGCAWSGRALPRRTRRVSSRRARFRSPPWSTSFSYSSISGRPALEQLPDLLLGLVQVRPVDLRERPAAERAEGVDARHPHRPRGLHLRVVLLSGEQRDKGFKSRKREQKRSKANKRGREQIRRLVLSTPDPFYSPPDPFIPGGEPVGG